MAPFSLRRLANAEAGAGRANRYRDAARAIPAFIAFVLLFAGGVVNAQYAPKEQTRLDITISASNDVNPDDKARAAPIMVRIYELKSEGSFTSADYFSLQGADKSVLGQDLLARDEFILRPGDSKLIRRKSHPDLGAIGVFAGYRDLGHAEWRAVQSVEPAPDVAWYRVVLPSNKVKLQVQLQAQGVRITRVE